VTFAQDEDSFGEQSKYSWGRAQVEPLSLSSGIHSSSGHSCVTSSPPRFGSPWWALLRQLTLTLLYLPHCWSPFPPIWPVPISMCLSKLVFPWPLVLNALSFLHSCLFILSLIHSESLPSGASWPAVIQQGCLRTSSWIQYILVTLNLPLSFYPLNIFLLQPYL
jgi:hypothetical protein